MSTQAIQKHQAPGGPVKPKALDVMAAKLSIDPTKLLETLKATVFKQATNEELIALVTVANEYGLNPFLKELYAFPAKGGGIVPIVSVDGWNKMLVRQPDFDGIEFEMIDKEDGTPFACTATISVKGRSKPMKITEYFDECHRNTEPWNNMPRRMLRNRALCQASRMAFGFSGVYNEDEAAAITVEATVMPSEPPPRLVAAPARETVTPQAELEALVIGAGYTFAQLVKFGEDSGNVTDADSLPGFGDIQTDEAKRMLKAKTGLLAALAKIKEGEGAK
jgi:phage recombination protein Bet